MVYDDEKNDGQVNEDQLAHGEGVPTLECVPDLNVRGRKLD